MGRATIAVDREILVRSVEKSEENGPRKNLDELWKSSAEVYNSLIGDDLQKISFSVVKARVEDWGISYKTVAGRKMKSKSSVDTPQVPQEIVYSEESDDELVPPVPYKTPEQSYKAPEPYRPLVSEPPKVVEPEAPNELGQFTPNQVYKELCNIRCGSLSIDRSGVFKAWDAGVRANLVSDDGFVDEIICKGFGGFNHAEHRIVLKMIKSVNCLASEEKAVVVEEAVA